MVLESPKQKSGLVFLGSTVSGEVIKEIDQRRGEIPRSRVVERALRQYLEREKTATTITVTGKGEPN